VQRFQKKNPKLPTWSRRLSVFDRAALKIALENARMPPQMAAVMGGPMPDDAKKQVRELARKAQAQKNPYRSIPARWTRVKVRRLGQHMQIAFGGRS
jgi:hypothetical protein